MASSFKAVTVGMISVKATNAGMVTPTEIDMRCSDPSGQMRMSVTVVLRLLVVELVVVRLWSSSVDKTTNV